MAAALPLDVLDVILRALAPHELALCCRLSRAVGPLAVDALYRDLCPTPRNLLALCLKLTSEPALAARTRSLVIVNNDIDMFLGVLADALLVLPRLATLVLNIGPAPVWILPDAPRCPFRLRTFACSFFLDAPLIAFLASQPDIRTLSVDALAFPSAHRAVTPSLLPQLAALSGPLSSVAALVPGRPVRAVTTHSAPRADMSAPAIACLARSTASGGVARLWINFRYLHTIPPADLAAAVPKLSALTVDADHVKPDDSDALYELTDWLEEYVSYTPALATLTVRFYPELSHIPVQEIDFSDMITTFFDASQSLRHVIILFHSYRAKYVCQRLPGEDWFIIND